MQSHLAAASRTPYRPAEPPVYAWPFRAPTPPHSRQEVEFADGNRIWLRPVIDHGEPSQFLRDLGAPAEGARIDLRHYVSDIAMIDRSRYTPREFAAHIASHLRQSFSTLDAFLVNVSTLARPE
jgi:hypothetical protein